MGNTPSEHCHCETPLQLYARSPALTFEAKHTHDDGLTTMVVKRYRIALPVTLHGTDAP